MTFSSRPNPIIPAQGRTSDWRKEAIQWPSRDQRWRDMNLDHEPGRFLILQPGYGFVEVEGGFASREEAEAYLNNWDFGPGARVVDQETDEPDESWRLSSKTAERRKLRMPYSEVNMYMRIAGEEMYGELTPDGSGVQLYDLEGNIFSFPITRNEAGWDLSYNQPATAKKVAYEAPKSEYSGACADREHSACKMTHLDVDNFCLCTDDFHYEGPLNNPPRGFKSDAYSEQSGACADGDHIDCEMAHVDFDSGLCLCPSPLHGGRTAKTAAVSKAKAEQVLKAVRKAFAPYAEEGQGPTLIMDWDSGFGSSPAIIWEEGPYEWTMAFPYGDIDPEFGGTWPDVTAEMPTDVFVEPITSYSLGIFDEPGHRY